MNRILALLHLAEIYAEFEWKEAARRAFLEAEQMLADHRPAHQWLTLELERQRIEKYVYLPTVR